MDVAGSRLGDHEGIQTVTVGQRRGLGIGGREPLYVLGTDRVSNAVTVGPRSELLTEAVPIRDVVLHRDSSRVDAVKLRYRGGRLACRLAGDLAAGEHPAATVELHAPAERTAPGQIACLYRGELIVGHATIG